MIPFKNELPIASEECRKEKISDAGNKSANLKYIGQISDGMKEGKG